MSAIGLARHPVYYRPLAKGTTRVFELEAGNLSDHIVGRLVPQAIDGEPYEAVSYVWGDTRNRRNIIIDGATLSITANLHAALTAFRHGPGHGLRRLWADAVCINQEDLKERISQVELMADIFAGARRVLAWLGWEEGDAGRRHTQAALRYIRFFMQDPEKGLRDARILLQHHDVASSAEQLVHLSEDDRRRFEEQARDWEAIKDFFEIEYFHRTWIVQELGLAREAIMYTALKPADGSETDVDNGSGDSDENNAQPLELDSCDWPLVGRFVEYLDYQGASLVTHLGLLSWVAHHILMIWQVKEDGTPNCDFLTGMHWARILRVTDARDRVYGLLGHPMAVIDGEFVIRPDYIITRGVAYTKLAANFIRKTKNLDVVSFVDHETDPCLEAKAWDPEFEARMPSWVPDWHSINRTTPMDYPVNAAEAEDMEISFDGETEGGIGTPLPHLLVRGWVVDEISAVSRRMETTDFPVTHLAREKAKQNPFWLDRVWEMVFPAEGPSNRDAFAMLESLSLALPLGTREKDQPVGKVEPYQPLDEHQRSFAAYVLDYHELWRGATEDKSNTDLSYLPARSVYDSLPVEMQAELRRRATGCTSRGFIESMTWPSMCRVVYSTRSGLVGMGSRVTQPGDLVCRVRGSPVLMTLRQIKDLGTGRESKLMPSSGTALIACAHIGPTVVPARMKADVVDGGKFGEKAAQFRIV